MIPAQVAYSWQMAKSF